LYKLTFILNTEIEWQTSHDSITMAYTHTSIGTHLLIPELSFFSQTHCHRCINWALTSTPSGTLDWNELEWVIWARSSHPTSVPDLTNALLDQFPKVPTETLQNLMKKPSQKSGDVIAATPYQCLHL